VAGLISGYAKKMPVVFEYLNIRNYRAEIIAMEFRQTDFAERMRPNHASLLK